MDNYYCKIGQRWIHSCFGFLCALNSNLVGLFCNVRMYQSQISIHVQINLAIHSQIHSHILSNTISNTKLIPVENFNLKFGVGWLRLMRKGHGAFLGEDICLDFFQIASKQKWKTTDILYPPKNILSQMSGAFLFPQVFLSEANISIGGSSKQIFWFSSKFLKIKFAIPQKETCYSSKWPNKVKLCCISLKSFKIQFWEDLTFLYSKNIPRIDDCLPR